MRKVLLSYFLGMLLSSLPLNWFSVYVFHDVDKDATNRLATAYRDLQIEFVAFVAIATLLLSLFLGLCRRLPRLQATPTNGGLAFLLGVGMLIFQYVYDIACRVLFPGEQDITLTVYLLLGPLACAAILLRNARSESPSPTEG